MGQCCGQNPKITKAGKRMGKILIAITFLLLFFTPADAAYLDLAWDANTEPVAGYRIYYGTASREYVDSIDVGNTTTYLLDGLLEGVTYYIAVTAYDVYGNESDFSNEVSSDTSGDAMPTADADTPSGGGGCFIATAAFSSTMDRYVKILAQFSDKRLANNHLGQRFIALLCPSQHP